MSVTSRPALAIRLLGRPEIARDGQQVAPPRGHKAWAVLAYLVLAERPVPRAQLARLVFGDADDPLAALRWSLAQLRRALGMPEALRGDPLAFALPDGATVDVLALAAGEPDPALVGGELLERVDPQAGAVFSAWLLVERRRLASLSEAALREAAMTALAEGDAREGAALASRAVALNPYDESGHELLVRCLARAGDADAAREHVAACEALFRRELGRVPDARVRRAAEQGPEPEPTAGDRAAALAQLDAGRAALDAGAVEPGVACLRQACAEAAGAGDRALQAQALATLGVALVHAVRGRDEEGAALLHDALVLAEAAGERAVAAKVCRELGYIEVQAARGAGAGRWLQRAGQLAVDDAERAAVLGIRGMALSDRAHYEPAVAFLTESVAIARACGDLRRAAWSLGLLGRLLMLRDSRAEAAAVLDESLALIEELRWIAFQPWPESLRAEVWLREGDPDRAAALLEHAFALGCRLGDPCWEAMSARARGLVHEAAGERARALAALREAADRAIRVADPYVWIHAHCLDALAGVAIADGAPDAERCVATLERLAARGDLRELVVRAALHRARLGDPGALASARLLGKAIDNPVLHAELTAAA